ncbi:hypothetical protein MCOR27_004567 [Pyricularia oryzae]|uniref:Acyl-coenzyme A diphosphatase SCS3 n=2 Tax=Pyricularia TaxID=48558 RepID=A0ABQ8NH72_PYRGI|nr:hypothetical protein MCOR01_007875 [Pyricularia oryzae]KAI6297009.1 hypothetical protein MCOR33_006552 [Pyricularia grisea]KAI6254791.1 hypothetical protein MCOR19_008716 [Pyricularia oryzae]KAI6273660.1 hypothetical protein MCOR26_006800 [Pyricularia oryzae]KAI6280645.1 hypothetical protein MCOR27_004567 [Pyricularia oryzae]
MTDSPISRKRPNSTVSTPISPSADSLHSPSSSRSSPSSSSSSRHPPYLPTRLETYVLALYPTLLVFGSAFALLSPAVRAAKYDPYAQAHVQDSTAPSYFARKDNVFNVLFVKRGWAWITGAFLTFVATHQGISPTAAKARAAVRWALVTGWWVLVTQWCFGPPLIDRGFRYTGGKCEAAQAAVAEDGVAGSAAKDVFSAAACRAAGGRWSGGHDISGHVFLLVLGSFFLVQEVGWVVIRWRARGWELRGKDTRTVVMADGAVKSADVEAEDLWEKSLLGAQEGWLDVLGLGGKVALAVVGLSLWMLLMTAIFFHTWFEKLTGLLVAFTGLYGVYFVPRLIPGLRALVGMPGI